MHMAVIPVTNESVRKIKVTPTKPDVVIFDGSLHGFGARVRLRKDGSVSRRFLFQYKAHGKHYRIDCGSLNERPATEARAKAQEYADAVRAGKNPALDKHTQQTKEVLTLGAAIRDYLAGPGAKLKGLAQTKAYLENSWRGLHVLPLASITRAHVSQVVENIEKKSGPSAANRARTALSAVYTKLAMRRDASLTNPVDGSYLAIEAEERDRALTDQELATVWLGLPNSDFGNIVRLCLLTGCRRNEIGGLKWSEVDLDKRTITLPKERTKNKRRHEVPLTNEAVTILQSQLRRPTDNVFGAGAGGFSNWNNAKRSLDKTVLIAHWTIHDTRRTVRTGLGKLGTPPHICEAVINHMPPKLLRTYDTNKYEAEKRRALEAWESHLLVCVAQATGGNVTALRKA
jgi:integrase